MSNIKFVACNSYEDLSKLVAKEFIYVVLKKPKAVLGLATGSSPIGIYNYLASNYQKENISFKELNDSSVEVMR